MDIDDPDDSTRWWYRVYEESRKATYDQFRDVLWVQVMHVAQPVVRGIREPVEDVTWISRQLETKIHND
jgi:hypothetical protein